MSVNYRVMLNMIIPKGWGISSWKRYYSINVEGVCEINFAKSNTSLSKLLDILLDSDMLLSTGIVN